jgi:hypothetical protein
LSFQTNIITGLLFRGQVTILYRSFLGTTKQYAEWLHEEIESDVFKYNKIKKESLLSYDLVILCTATYAGWISLKVYLKKRWDILKDKKVVLLVVGSAPADDEWTIRSYKKIPEEIRENIKYFKLPGKMSSKDTDAVKKENLALVIEYLNSLE